jgi:hypothetical protein
MPVYAATVWHQDAWACWMIYAPLPTQLCAVDAAEAAKCPAAPPTDAVVKVAKACGEWVSHIGWILWLTHSLLNSTTIAALVVLTTLG